MQVSESLDCIGEGLLVNLWVLRPDAVADRPIVVAAKANLCQNSVILMCL